MPPTRLSLDGAWSFEHRIDRHAAPSSPRQITVPGPWQAQFADLRMKTGIGTYRRDIELAEDQLEGRRIYLHFGAVFHHATVWVGGARVGAHEGGFLSFSFDVTPYLRAGRNEIVVEAETPSDDPALYPDAPFAEIPFGKQSWYGPLSGIWQPVFLEWRTLDHVESIAILSASLSGAVNVELFFRSPLSLPATVSVEVLDPQDRVLARATPEAESGQSSLRLGFELDVVCPWSPDCPDLYRIRATLDHGTEVVDWQTDRFGFRTIEARDGAFYLNGERFYLRAALDQDYYPETICTLPSVEFLEDEFRKAKHLGLNCLRLHIKVPDPRYYEVADRLGMLIWTELPNGGLTTERSRKRKERLLRGIVDRDRNHPSIIIWTIINENWGVDLVHDPDHRTWLKKTFAWLKRHDPSRLVVDNSPLAPSFHVQTDIADYHFYAAIPDHREAWDRFVHKLAGSSAWLFSPEGDAVVTGTEPRLCSEFGNWGLPNPNDLRDAQGREPWWFESGHDWGDGVMYPHGIEQRFEDWSLDRVFGSLGDLAEAAQWQQFRALKYQIEAMRRRPELAGYVITELTDVHWESNGLLDMRRTPRVFHDAFRTINADTIVTPTWDRVSYWDGETPRFRLAVASCGKEAIRGATLTVTSPGGSREVLVPDVTVGGVADLGLVEVSALGSMSTGLQHVTFDLRGHDGASLATNSLALAVHTRPDPETRATILVWSADPDIRAYLEELGYKIGSGPDRADLIVASDLSDELTLAVRQSGKALLLPSRPCHLQPFFPHWQNVRVQTREDSLWQGDWASSFAWLRRSGLFSDFPSGPLLDESFDRVLPEQIITGCNLLDFQARVHAGMVVGWVHRPAALVVEKGYGKGWVVASTFRLFRDQPHADPTATKLIDKLVRLTLNVARVDSP